MNSHSRASAVTISKKKNLLWGLHTKITQCNIFKCVMNASQKPIQILGYQISLNKSPHIEFSLLWRLERSGLQGRFYHATQTPRHTQERAADGKAQRVNRAGRWFNNDGLYWVFIFNYSRAAWRQRSRTTVTNNSSHETWIWHLLRDE